jgi:cytoskeletal protein RodZ
MIMRATLSIVVALLGSAGIFNQSMAQQSAPSAGGQQQQQQERAQQTPAGKAGTEEPSSHAPANTPQDNAVFVNGALAVPGAPTETDTVPAKYSAKNAADDKLITVAYTFKSLTADERQSIYQSLKDRPAGSAPNADIGAVLPVAVELRALPGEVTARVPQTEGYQYSVAGNRILLVSPPTRIVVGVFTGRKEPDESLGRRTP